MALFNEINSGGTTIVIVTHDPRVGAAIRRCIHIFDGQIKADVMQTPVPFSGDSFDSEVKTEKQKAVPSGLLARTQAQPCVQPAKPRAAPVKEQPSEQSMPDLGSLPPAARNAYLNGTIL